MTAGLRSIGWYVPEGRLTGDEVARLYGLSEEAVAKYGLKTRVVAGDDDHSSLMGAKATRYALTAANLTVSDLDLLIFAGVTREWPTPWVAAFGVLHELGAEHSAGFDVASRCAGVVDALWIAKLMVESGTHHTVAVCCADRFDHVLKSDQVPEFAAQVVYAAGACTAIIAEQAANEIVAFAESTFPDLSRHRVMGPVAGGTSVPFDESALDKGLHLWSDQRTMRNLIDEKRFGYEADHRNFAALYEAADFEDVDFVVCSPLEQAPQLETLAALGIDLDKTLFPIPHLGHLGPADYLLSLGIAQVVKRPVGPRAILTSRSITAAKAIALRGKGSGLGIAVAGEGLDPTIWSGSEGEQCP